jgi:hypothetical protein
MKKRINKLENAKLPKHAQGAEDGKDSNDKNDPDKNYNGEGQKDKTVVNVSHHTPNVVSVLQQSNIPLLNNNERGPRMGNMDLVQLGTTGIQNEETKKEGARKKRVKQV